jgi:hypothetical protein
MALIGCGSGATAAGKRYARRVSVTMAIYVVLVFGAALYVKHFSPHGWLLYLWALLPAIPLIAMVGAMGLYLQEEKDEYLRMLTVRSLLAGTGVLIVTLVVNDFLRSFAKGGPLPPFVAYVMFFIAFGATQAVQTMRNRGGGDD